MGYRALFNEENNRVSERLESAMERISLIKEEEIVPLPYRAYFISVADFIGQIYDLIKKIENGHIDSMSFDELLSYNQKLYEDVHEHYEESYANPDVAGRELTDYGPYLCFLYTEIRTMIHYGFDGRWAPIVRLCELFLEIYVSFEDSVLPKASSVGQAIYWFISDYSDQTVEDRIREQLDPSFSRTLEIIMTADLENLSYLFKYGDYISENEIETAKYLNTLPEEEIKKMAQTFTGGYKKGFELAGIDLSKKKTVAIRGCIGFERVIREAVKSFKEIGLETIIYPAMTDSLNRRAMRIGFYGTSENNQYLYDHRQDQALYMNKALVERKLAMQKVAYERYRDLAEVFAGPACMEVFGEKPFEPVSKESACRYTEKQEKLMVDYNNQSAMLSNTYMDRSKISFTIIAYPLPEIGENYQEIFSEVVKVNILDYEKYQRIQQTIIDTLDTGVAVEILGCGDNQTDLTIALHPLKDHTKETIFENCVADVNIPVGEVFTSPVLEGTNGMLCVSQVYLNDLLYKDLKVIFKDGKTTDYMCSNFDDPKENQKYFKENVLFNHDSLPMGEFAIGTNTTAYVMAKNYHILDKMPILIMEKTGPHFALGDTCYSRSEENKVYNPDGKEIIARDNEVSLKRIHAPQEAYFNCHTDITIPYEEIGCIRVVDKDGRKTDIIRNGRFVLNGTEELNEAFDNLCL